MDKKQAQEIVKNTFENPFDKDRFISFVKNLLNSIEEAPFSYRGNLIPDAYEQSISTLERIGKYTDGEHKIDILVVKLKKETSIERARTMQRNFIAWYLNGSRGGEMKDAALVAFVSPDEDDWRFSLVKMDYRFVEDEKGRTRVKEEFTPARRWSFLVGKNENSHTAKSQLVPIIEDDEHNPTLAQLEDAFNIEKVTREFFEKYRELFLLTEETLDKIVTQEAKISADFSAKGINTVDFAKKLLGQIVFLYFLQKKGWFGVKRDANWGTGPKNFLRELFEGKHGNYQNFFNDILEPLFYQALRNDRRHDDDYYDRFNCKIPFLNGGLFDPINNYDWVHTDILLPTELFSNTNKTKEGDTGNGILDIFDRYNFTVKEDEPLEKEVAVDPEMLGKVFENLLEVKDRKSKGTYYTPREIVHYMCQQSLINYMATELVGKVSKGDIETLIKYGEQVGENEARVEAKGRETDTYSYKLPESIRQNAKLIDEKLANIKVCDPAIGSGAFPVGMMSEIVKARNTLTTYLNPKNVILSDIEESKLRTIYHFKRECIEKSLYGVDIDPGAVEIAKLRLWLSLVVDEEDIKQIKPLPNLDYKIVCGNSLLGVKEDLFNQQLFEELERLKPLLFNETNPSKKQEYKKQIDELILQITKGHKEFDFHVYFSEVFHEKKGFDVVIANPPYVSFGLRGVGKADNSLRDIYPNSAEYKLSIYAIFIDKGTQLLQSHGILCYITPDSFLLGRYFSKLRKHTLNTCRIIEILMFEKDFWESGVVGRPVITILEREPDTDLLKNNTPSYSLYHSLDDFNTGTVRAFSYPQEYFATTPHNRFRLFFEQSQKSLADKLQAGSKSLSEFVAFASGLIGKKGKNEIISKEKRGPGWHPGLLSGSEIKKYIVNYEGNFICFDTKVLKSGFRDANYFEPKIFLRQTGDSLIAAYDDNNLLCLNNLHVGNLKGKKYSLKYILALLNSTLLSYYYRLISLETGRTMAQTDIETIELLPIKIPSSDIQNKIVSFVDRILAITKDEDYLQNPEKQTQVKALEQEIDQLVDSLYGLTEEEIRIVEESVGK